MTKEEKIKEAWMDLIPDYTGYTNIDLNSGWSVDKFDEDEFDEDEFDTMQIYVPCRIRPKSLQGIENNNGWIKIESEKDLPEETGPYDVVISKKKTTATYIGKDRWFVDGNDFPKTTKLHRITHYLPVEKQKLPIY